MGDLYFPYGRTWFEFQLLQLHSGIHDGHLENNNGWICTWARALGGDNGWIKQLEPSYQVGVADSFKILLSACPGHGY